MTALDDFLAIPANERCWLLELAAQSLNPTGSSSAGFGDAGFGELGFGEDEAGGSGIVTLTFSDRGFTSSSADAPADTYYDPRIDDRASVKRDAYSSSAVGGLVRISGEVRLVNNDGGLDALLQNYALDGRTATLLIGRTTDARADFNTVFRGIVATRPHVGFSEVILPLSDASGRLSRPLNTNVYAGSGSVEGGADLKGKYKPKGYGACRNVRAVLVDSANLIYQVNDGAISDVPNCWDRQIALAKGADYASLVDMTTNAPAAGNYRVWKGGGYFRLGSNPAGEVTSDVLGDAVGGYINTTADILNRILTTQGGLGAPEIDAAAIAALNVDQPSAVGIWRGVEGDSIAAVIDELLQNAGAFGGLSRTGVFTCAVLKAPNAGAAVAAYGLEEIRKVEREPLPADVEPIVSRSIVGYQKNYTVQTDLAAGVTAARKDFAGQAERVSGTVSDATVLANHPLAKEYGPTGALFDVQGDAANEATRRQGVWGVERGIYRVDMVPAGLARDIGEQVTLTFNRFGWGGGVDARIIGHQFKGQDVTLRVLV